VTLTADIAYGQIIGQRQRQEDRLAVVRDGEDGPARFLVLSDGMGGAVGGDIAAGVIVDTVVEALDGAAGGAGAAGSALRAAAVAANKALRARVRADPGLDGMGGTLVIVRLAGAGLLFFSMGDSPLRLVRAGQAIRLNADHSVGGMLDAQVARGEISAAAAAERRDRNSIVSVLTGGPIGGMRMDESADLTPLAAGDVLVLASDGLDTLAAEEIAAVAGQDRPAVELAEALLAAVEAADRPRQDNASVIVARFRPS
jgi:protein phosphatase